MSIDKTTNEWLDRYLKIPITNIPSNEVAQRNYINWLINYFEKSMKSVLGAIDVFCSNEERFKDGLEMSSSNEAYIEKEFKTINNLRLAFLNETTFNIDDFLEFKNWENPEEYDEYNY